MSILHSVYTFPRKGRQSETILIYLSFFCRRILDSQRIAFISLGYDLALIDLEINKAATHLLYELIEEIETF